MRSVKEGTSAVLLQSGLDEIWWADSLECRCYLRNVQDLLAGGKTPYGRRFGEQFKGPIVPFEAMVFNITRFQCEISQYSIILAREFYLGSFLGMS